ncbi:MAG: ribosomal L7Ae/L30e/S12e/Gadd45 family protein [Oscillospiraceae bacterium]|jgi:ribosomal protein L7Ae-like RNA K-turn-binding protein
MDRALSYLGLAQKAGLLEAGEESAGAAARRGKAKLLLLAADASDNARRRAEGFVYGRKIPLARLPFTKEQISAATGRPGCSMVALTDTGLASSIMKTLAEASPDEYGAIAEELRLKNETAARRRREAAAHQRNKRLGKKRAERKTDGGK